MKERGGGRKGTPHLSPSHFQVADVLPDAPKHTQARPPSNPQEPDMSDSSVKVCVRLRPFNERELAGKGKGSAPRFGDTGRTVWVGPEEANGHTYALDAVLSPEATQSDVYNHASNLVDAVVQGYNATILAYGQTGSGKTYTMEGDVDDDEPDDDEGEEAARRAGANVRTPGIGRRAARRDGHRRGARGVLPAYTPSGVCCPTCAEQSSIPSHSRLHLQSFLKLGTRHPLQRTTHRAQ